MYLLIKRGVYRHDVLGCWTSIDTAKREATDSVLAEHDHYHDVEIFEIVPDTAGEKLLGSMTYNKATGVVDWSGE